MKQSVKEIGLEKFYFDGKNNETRTEISLVSNRDPLFVEYEDNLIGFRFFNKLSITDDGEPVFFGTFDYSGKYYFGDRMAKNNSDDSLQEDIITQLQREYLDRNGLDSAIFCKCGAIITSIRECDQTVDEVRKQRMLENDEVLKTFINQSDFIEGIARVLELHGNNVTVTISDTREVVSDMDVLGDVTAVIRNYSIYVDEYRKLSFDGVVPNVTCLGNEGQDTYCKVGDVSQVLKPLYAEYPYLSDAMDRLKTAVAYGECEDIISVLLGNDNLDRGNVKVKATDEVKLD